MYPKELENLILSLTQSNSIESIKTVQKLWSGYGSLDRVNLIDGNVKSLIVKFIDFSSRKEHPRGWNTSISHKRKIDSYKVETNFYKNYSFLRSSNSYFPKLIHSDIKDEIIILILEDLKEKSFSKVIQKADDKEIKLCLRWLAKFHSEGFESKNKGIWEKGTYWHISTRKEEFEKMPESKLKSKAYEIDKILNEAKYQTVLHGDAKIANFLFSKNSDKVAGVDFQYVGYGSPIKDLIYLLGSVLDNDSLSLDFQNYKKYYYNYLTKYLKNKQLEFLKIIEELEELWQFAIADFERFLLGWMPTHHKLTKFSEEITQNAISKL